MEKVIRSAPKKRDRLFLLVLSRTGRRISEVLGQRVEHAGMAVKAPGLRPKDIDDRDNKLVFTVLKKKRPETVVNIVPGSLIKELQDYVREYNIGDDKPIFKFGRKNGYYVVRNAWKASGIGPVGQKKGPLHPHHFRHSFAIAMARKLKDPRDIAKLKNMLAHSSLEMTLWYISHYSLAEQQALIEDTWGK